MRTQAEVRAEVHALWAAVFGEPPILEAPTAMLIDALVASLPTADYDTLRRFDAVPPSIERQPPGHSAAGGSGPSSA